MQYNKTISHAAIPPQILALTVLQLLLLHHNPILCLINPVPIIRIILQHPHQPQYLHLPPTLTFLQFLQFPQFPPQESQIITNENSQHIVTVIYIIYIVLVLYL